MAKARANASTARPSAPAAAPAAPTGPPMLILGLGFASALVSLPLVVADQFGAHLIGYLVGAMVPILVIGLARRIDLDRRRSPGYQAKRLFQVGLVVLAVVAMAAALLNVWPMATELAT